MSNDLVEFDDAPQLPAHLANQFGDDATDDLITSSGGFPVLSIKGSKWRIKVGGEEVPLINPDTDDPVPSIEVVIIRSAKGMTKNFYGQNYTEGDDSPPDCMSHDGVLPDPSSPKKQCDSCAACPQNAWGSKITDAGTKAKACSDSKSIAVTWVGDMANEALGGPMLLRVPPASLKDMSTFARKMKAKGYVPQQIAIRIGFDVEVAYPKLTFKAVRPLSNEEVEVVGELYDSDQVSDMMHLSGAPAAQQNAPAQLEDNTAFEEEAPAAVPTAVPSTKKAPAKKATAKKAPAKKPSAKKAVAPAAAEAPIEGEVVEEPTAQTEVVNSDIDDILGDLDD